MIKFTATYLRILSLIGCWCSLIWLDMYKDGLKEANEIAYIIFSVSMVSFILTLFKSNKNNL